MARSYARDGAGRFASGGSKGDRAETIQQNKAKKDKERKSKKDELSGTKLGGHRTRRVKRTNSAGKHATTKAMKRGIQRAKARFA